MAETATASNRRRVALAIEHWNRGDLDAYLEIYANDVVIHGYAGLGPGIDSVRLYYQAWFEAFPGSQILLKDLFAEGDKVCCRLVLEGTHQGAFNGIPPTGKSISVPAFTVLLLADGKCVERWALADSLLLLTQIGAFPLHR